MANDASKHRGWCLTINNPIPFASPVFAAANVTYWIRGSEVGAGGTPHWQCYVYFRNAVRFSTLKRLYPRAHIDWARGSPTENRVYCSKAGEFEEGGVCPEQRKRNDLAAMYTAIKSGASDLAMLEAEPATWMRYHRAVRAARFVWNSSNVAHIPVTVRVYWGASGSGKTSRVHREFPDVYTVDTSSSSTLWWDGYTGQSAILFDDFYGQVKYAHMLQLTDRYRINLQIKGGYTIKAYTHVFFTSNKPPDEWWPNVEDKSAMSRRIDSIEEILLGPVFGPGH